MTSFGKNQRKEVRIRASIRILSPGPERKELGYTKNLSRSGLYLITDHHFEKDDEVNLIINYMNTELEVLAHIAHVQEDGVGVRFLSPLKEVNQVLTTVIQDMLAISTRNQGHKKDEAYAPTEPVVWESEGIQVESVIGSIGSGGMFIESATQPQIMSTITVYLPGVGSDPFEGDNSSHVVGCTSEVITREKNGFGIIFVKPSPEFQAAANLLAGFTNLDI